MDVPDRTIARVLVANRGEIARRVFRTCRELGVGTVAVYSDADAGLPFAREADVAVPLGGASPAESYLRADAVVAAALAAGADAVHPGYGFLSENAEFAESVLDAGLAWIGPPPDAIRAMGSKIQARSMMEAAGVPVMGGATIDADSDLAALADGIGFPVLAKASAGGGGKGMRIVRDPAELERAVEAARREALAAFGDDSLFLERYVDDPRHVEIQIFGDRHGRVVSLHERDCSIQRRHQKVIEESPSPALDPQLRASMGAAAVAAGERLGYVGAGTVEFLLTPDGEFFFLEVNTRLQVEHPVTEAVTGLDLVALQIAVAEGRPLPPEACDAAQSGHAIEARIYAEDPEQGFLPVTGRLERFRVPPGVRVDTGVEDGSEVSPHYDPMLAKVVAHAPTRTQAARRLADALTRAELHGLTTNRDFLVRVLAHPEFAAGRTDTHFLERHDPAALGAALVDADGEWRHAVAAALAGQAERGAGAGPVPGLAPGWRSNPSQLQEATYEGRHGSWAVGYRFGRRGGLEAVRVGDRELADVRLHACTAEAVDLEADGLRLRCRVRRGAGARVEVNSALGQVALTEAPRFPRAESADAPGSLTSPMPGTVLRVLPDIGARVARGEPIVVIEAMKMEHEITAPTDGTLAELLVAEGAQIEAGAVLAVLDEGG